MTAPAAPTTSDDAEPRDVPAHLVLTVLRRAAPDGPIAFDDALSLAEHQGELLRECLGTTEARLAHEPIAALPRIVVTVDADLPVSGSAHWDGANWIVTLNATENLARRRWSLLHEIKHIVDHADRARLYGPRGDAAAAEAAERAADTFAAAALMPAAWVLRLWRLGISEPAELADRFEVTTGAARYRLSQLGLIPTYYHRPLSVHLTSWHPSGPNHTIGSPQTSPADDTSATAHRPDTDLAIDATIEPDGRLAP